MGRRVLCLALGLAMLASMAGVAAPPEPVRAASQWYVDPSGTDDLSHGGAPGAGAFRTIQYAVNDSRVVSGDNISVAAGTYRGACIMNKRVAIAGAGPTDNRPVITSGYSYSSGNPGTAGLTTGFRLDATADGSEIRNFTINCNPAASFYFGVFARDADSVVVDSVTINDPVQGITNWGGSHWQITNNALSDTGSPTSGGGIGILLGVRYGAGASCSYNYIYNNLITSTEAAAEYTCPGILMWLDLRYSYGPGGYPSGSENITGNQIVGNRYQGSRITNQVGIEVGVAFEAPQNPPTPAKIAACLPIIHDNTISGNVLHGADYGLYVYTATRLQVLDNDISDCLGEAISLDDGWSGGGFACNTLSGNGYGLSNDATVGDATVDATSNWWGCAGGPGAGGCDPVSSDVIYDPWLQAIPGSGAAVSTFTGTGMAVLSTDAGGMQSLAAAGLPGGAPDLLFGHGLFSFTNCCLTAGSSATITISLPSAVPVGTEYWKFGPTASNPFDHWYRIPMGSDDGDNVITITLTDGGPGDDDLVANGQIVDQGGPGWPSPGSGTGGRSVTAFPALWAGIAAAAALGIAGAFARVRRSFGIQSVGQGRRR